MMKEYAKQGQAGRMAYAVMAASAPYILATLWNYSDDKRRQTEESLPPWKRWNMHVNIGKDKIAYINLPLDDVLNFLGIEEHIVDFQRYNRGQINVNELVQRIAINAFEQPSMAVVNMTGGAAGIARDAIGVQTFPELKPYLITDRKRKGWNISKDIFGAPAQLGEAIVRDKDTKVRDLLWRSIIPFGRAYTNDIAVIKEQYSRSVYKRNTTVQGVRKRRGQPHKGKERLVDTLRAQLKGR